MVGVASPGGIVSPSPVNSESKNRVKTQVTATGSAAIAAPAEAAVPAAPDVVRRPSGPHRRRQESDADRLPDVPPTSGSAPRRPRRVLTTVVRELIEYRDLLYQLTLRDVRIRYAQAVMGLAWAVLMPIVIVLSGLLIRFAMAQTADIGLGRAVIAGIALKGLMWSFFSSAVNLGTSSLVANKHLITKLYFPREALPLAALLAQAFDLAIGLVVMALLLPFLGATASAHLLWLPLLMVMLLALTLAFTTLLSCANLFFRDVKYIVQIMMTFGIFLAPVFIEPAMFGPVGARIAMLNPIAPILEGARLAVVQGHNLLEPLTVVTPAGASVLAWTPWDLVWSVVFTVLFLHVSVRVFRRASALFAEYA